MSNRPTGCLTRPIPAPRVVKTLVNAATSYAQAVQSTSIKVKLPEAFVKNYNFPTQVQAAPQGKGSSPNYTDIYQAYTTYHPWRSIAAYMKAEPDGTIKASIRQARQVYLIQQRDGNPIIFLCDVNKKSESSTYTTSNTKVGAAAKLIGVDGREQNEDEFENITDESRFRLWNYRITENHQDVLFQIIKDRNLPIVVGRRATEYRDGMMCATVEVWETLAEEYDKACKDAEETATFSYGEKSDFMSDGYAHLQATISPKFSTRIEPAARRKQQLQMAAAICRLGGTVFLNGSIIRIQANKESLFKNLISATQQLTEENPNVYPVRTDIPTKSVIQAMTEEQPKPHTPPPEGHKQMLLNHNEALSKELWDVVLNEIGFCRDTTNSDRTTNKCIVLVKVNEECTKRRFRHTFGDFYLEDLTQTALPENPTPTEGNDGQQPQFQSPNESPQSQSHMAASQRQVIEVE